MPTQPTNTPTWKASDFAKDPLFLFNSYFQRIYSKLTALYSAGPVTLQSDLTVNTIKAVGQTTPPTDPTSLLTKAQADNLYGIEQTRAGLLSGANPFVTKLSTGEIVKTLQPIIFGGSGGGVSGIAQKATFWVGMGGNQPVATDVCEYGAAFTAERATPFTTAVWRYAFIYSINPPTTGDFVIDLKLNGSSIFNSSKLVLPMGTAVGVIVVHTNFISPSGTIAEKTSAITCDVVNSPPETMNTTAVLMFDLQ